VVQDLLDLHFEPTNFVSVDVLPSPIELQVVHFHLTRYRVTD